MGVSCLALDPVSPNGEPSVDWGLLKKAQMVADTNPGFVRMRRHPEFQSWAADLVRFGEREDLRPMAEVLKQVASNAMVGDPTTESFASLMKLFHDTGSNIDLRTLWTASKVAEDAADRPYASFVLAWVALCIWILCAAARGEQLYGEKEPWPGWPHPGWGYIPVACVATSVKLQGLYGSALLAKEAYEVLQASRRRHSEAVNVLEPAISRYRHLGQTIATRYDMAISNLVDELRDACRGPSGRTRYLLAALLWSLGLVPESNALRSLAEAPNRGLLRRLVQSSLQCLPSDPLIQYIWLELKDDRGANLRAHEALLTVINHRWNQWWMDDEFAAFGLGAEPSRLYARTLVSLLAGDLDQSRATEYLQAYDLIDTAHLRSPEKGFIPQRLQLLRHLIGERFDYYAPEVTHDKRVESLKKQMEGAGRRREQAVHHPDWPDALGRTTVAGFEVIERCLSDETPLTWSETDRCVLVLEMLERVRTGALAYWLWANPPLTLVAESSDLQKLLQEERELLDGLRGAYFVVLRPSLPLVFEWSDMSCGDFIDLQDPSARERFYSPEVAREEMERIERALANTAQRLQPHAPEYAEQRLLPNAGLERIVASLNRHTRRSLIDR